MAVQLSGATISAILVRRTGKASLSAENPHSCSVWEESNEIDLDDLRAGWGIGLRIIIPQMNLPVNLDYSWPLDPDEFTEDEGRFDFSLGFDF